MGWSDGNIFAEKYIEVCKVYVPEKHRRELYKKYMRFLSDQDWDDWLSSMGQDKIWDEELRIYLMREELWYEEDQEYFEEIQSRYVDV